MKKAKFIHIGLILTLFAVLANLTANVVPVLAEKDKNHKVVICHGAGQEGTLHYNTLEIDEDSVYGRNGNAGHFEENGTPQAGHEHDYFGACNSDITPTIAPTIEPTPTAVVPTTIPTLTPTSDPVDPTQTPTVTIGITDPVDPTITLEPTLALTQTPSPTVTLEPTITLTPTQALTPTPTNSSSDNSNNSNNNSSNNNSNSSNNNTNSSSNSNSAPTTSIRRYRSNPVIAGVVQSTSRQILGTADNFNPLVSGLKLSFGGEVLGATTELAQTAEVVNSSEKLPTSNVVDPDHTLTIPALNINEPVYLGQKIGDNYIIGHHEILLDTSLSASLYYAHNGKGLFSHLSQLTVGDQIIDTRGGQSLIYQVTSIKTIKSTDVKAIKSTDDTIYLMTCVALGSPDRVLVTASLTSHE